MIFTVLLKALEDLPKEKVDELLQHDPGDPQLLEKLREHNKARHSRIMNRASQEPARSRVQSDARVTHFDNINQLATQAIREARAKHVKK